jgi:cobalt-zinc-cadmium efflux system outer membrane protein
MELDMPNRWILLPLVGLAGIAQAAPLSFNAALDLAERQSPSLAAQAAKIEAARSAAIAADALPDPKAFVGVDNLPINGADSWSVNRDFMTMRKIGLMQDVPNSDKRRARTEVAKAEIDQAEGERRIERLKVRREAALSWINRYFRERRSALFDQLERENSIMAEAVRAQLAAGRGQPSDVVIPKQEAAQLADRRDDLIRDLTKAKSELRRYVGSEADEPLAGKPPGFDVDPDTLRKHLLHHPDLQIFGSMTRKAEAEVHEAEAMRESDWGVALAYQKRGPLFSDMASIQFTFDLPLFTKTRQNPLIAAKQQQLVQVEAERDAMLRDHTAELENELSDYATLTRQLDRMNQVWLPLAGEKFDLQLASYRAGKGDVAAVINARQEWVEQRLKAVELDNQLETVAAKLYFAYGEDMQ